MPVTFVLPEENLEPREFVCDINRVQTLLQPEFVYVLPGIPQAETHTVWPNERTMLVWKGDAGVWHFKMRLLGERHQGMFDAGVQDDAEIIECLNNLVIERDVTEKLSNHVDSERYTYMRLRLSRPCVRLTLDQQTKIIQALQISWPLEDDMSLDAQVRILLALLCGDSAELTEKEVACVDEFAYFLSLENINRLLGTSQAQIDRFHATNNNITSGDVLRFIQFLLLAAVKKAGHDEPVVLPFLPEGSEQRYGVVTPSTDQGGLLSTVSQSIAVFQFIIEIISLPVRETQAQRRRIDMLEPIARFEAALTALEASVSDLDNDDHARLTESLDALRNAKTAWVDSMHGMRDVLTFRRATNDVLREAHIQRLYTSPRYSRLGMFSDHVESPELQQLGLCLRDLRDVSVVRKDACKQIKESDEVLWVLLTFIFAFCVLMSILSLNIAFVWLTPLFGLLYASAHYGTEVSFFLIHLFLKTIAHDVFFDVWSIQIEASRELFTQRLLQILGAALVISVGCGLLTGEFSSALAVLAMTGMMFGAGFALTSAVVMGMLVVGTAIMLGVVAVAEALSYMNHVIASDEHIQEEVPEVTVHDDLEEEIGLTPT